jgi:uncharacterized protein
VTTPEDVGNIPLQELRVVCDTNVLVSAVMFPESTPGRAFTHARHAGKLLTTPDLASELRDVLSRPKMARYIAEDLRDEFLAAYLAMAEFVVTTEQITACRDPKDNQVLETAIDGHATCILSGDKDLLVLNPFRDIPILTPSEFLGLYLPS